MFRKKSYTVRYSIDPENNDLHGTLEPGNYSFSALVYGKPSEHGIDNGRISKLTIQDRMGREIVNYQRGFNECNGKPEKLSREQTQLIEAMKKEFPADRTWTPEQQAIFDRNEANRAAHFKAELDAKESKEEIDVSATAPENKFSQVEKILWAAGNMHSHYDIVEENNGFSLIRTWELDDEALSEHSLNQEERYAWTQTISDMEELIFQNAAEHNGHLWVSSLSETCRNLQSQRDAQSTNSSNAKDGNRHELPPLFRRKPDRPVGAMADIHPLDAEPSERKIIEKDPPRPHIGIDTKLTSEWFQEGRVRPGSFEYIAKVYFEPSSYGIDDSEVSKLRVCDRDGAIVANYDRGWDVKPEPGSAAARTVRQIVAFYRDNARDMPEEQSKPEPIKQIGRAAENSNPMGFFQKQGRNQGAQSLSSSDARDPDLSDNSPAKDAGAWTKEERAAFLARIVDDVKFKLSPYIDRDGRPDPDRLTKDEAQQVLQTVMQDIGTEVGWEQFESEAIKADREQRDAQAAVRERADQEMDDDYEL